MNTDDIISLGRRYLVQNYRQPDFVLVAGRGARVRDTEGNEYVDLICGIATGILGHCHPKVTAAISDQAGRLVHVSNLYFNEVQNRLAEKLVRTCFAERVFFCNSGAEANEAAIKLARRYHHDRGDPRHVIVSFEGGFHGRTFAALAATAQPKYHEGFGPMPEGFVYLPYGDAEAADAAIGSKTAAVIVEAIQGEGGLIVPPEGYLAELRRLCDERGVLLIMDEVQSGVGRTGKMWLHQHEHVTPDIMTSAKALGNGMPIGAMLTTEEIAASMVPGTHASTFGGNPLACAAAYAVLEALIDDGLMTEGVKAAERFWNKLEKHVVGRGPVKGIRGKGMWIGLVVGSGAKDLVASAARAGVLVNAAGDAVVRLAPPVTLTAEDMDEAIERLSLAWGLT